MWSWLQFLGLRISVALAQAGQATSGGGLGQNPAGGARTITIPNPLGPCVELRCVVFNLLNKMLIFAYPIVTVMVLVGAFQILTAGGNSEKVSTGRKTIMYAVIGFALVLLAQGFGYVVQDILGAGS